MIRGVLGLECVVCKWIAATTPLKMCIYMTIACNK